MVPSMAILTTPERSHKIPASAPSVMGVARRTMRPSMSTMSVRLLTMAVSKILTITTAITPPM